MIRNHTGIPTDQTVQALDKTLKRFFAGLVWPADEMLGERRARGRAERERVAYNRRARHVVV